MNPKPILFVDFDGTICHERYWRSLPAKYHEKVQELLFRDDTTRVNDWMRGKYSAEQVNKWLAEQIGISYDELWRLFIEDCRSMYVSRNILDELSALRDQYIVILITGNMDSFSRFTAPALKLEDYFDYISNSYYEGKHKTDSNGELFLDYANKLDANIKDCAIIDDSPKGCDIFEKLGGVAHRITPDTDINYYLERLA